MHGVAFPEHHCHGSVSDLGVVFTDPEGLIFAPTARLIFLFLDAVLKLFTKQRSCSCDWKAVPKPQLSGCCKTPLVSSLIFSVVSFYLIQCQL